MNLFHTLEKISAGDEFRGGLLIREASLRYTKNDKPYLALRFTDTSGADITANLWDATEEQQNLFTPGTTVEVTGGVENWNGRLQLNLRRLEPAPHYDIRDFVPSAPEDPEAMFAEIRKTASEIGDTQIRAVTEDILDRKKAAVLNAPAAKSVHHDVRGGLLWHTVQMLRSAKALCGVYPELNADLLCAGVILHDLAKTREMHLDPAGLVDDYTLEGKMKGHLAMGSEEVTAACRRLGVDREREILLSHMILSHHGTREQGAVQPPLTAEAHALHFLDMIDSRLNGIFKLLGQTEPGAFSQKALVTGNQPVYRPVLAQRE